MSGLTVAQIEEGLVALGIPKEKAHWQAMQECGLHDATTARAPTYRAPLPSPPPSAWPLRITLPWSTLVSDNARYTVHYGRLHLTKPYRAARKAIRHRVRDLMGGTLPVEFPLRLEARVWVPDRRLHDCCNFAKGVADALEKHVYTSDKWLYEVHWIRAGVDVDAPRAELRITPLPPTA
jgi:Holliday junction resolvase RusA-like endonuclease